MNFMSHWNLESFYYSFYVWWLFFVSVAFGATFFVLIHFATKASWSVTLRRLAENISLTLPALFLFGIICYFGRDTLYHHWLSSESFADSVLNSKRWYLNTTFFRYVLYFFLPYFLWRHFYLHVNQTNKIKQALFILRIKCKK